MANDNTFWAVVGLIPGLVLIYGLGMFTMFLMTREGREGRTEEAGEAFRKNRRHKGTEARSGAMGTE